MKQDHYTRKWRWDEAVKFLSEKFRVYAPTSQWGSSDYQLIDRQNASSVIYNQARPSTPLKHFFLPVKENVTNSDDPPHTIIIGVPNCDLAGLALLDKIYMDELFDDPLYRLRRASTTLIASDCFDTAPHCHCTTYGINPYPESLFDISLAVIDDQVILNVRSDKGEEIVKNIEQFLEEEDPGNQALQWRDEKRQKTILNLGTMNAGLPDYATTGELIVGSDSHSWNQYAENCVSCGACTASCPTCTCFLLSDRDGFEKVRSLDACQYPGFGRVAAGEDPLRALAQRFKNRYLCKYKWKPDRFEVQACTGCGRCIDGCIGNIDKNEIFRDIAKLTVT